MKKVVEELALFGSEIWYACTEFWRASIAEKALILLVLLLIGTINRVAIKFVVWAWE